MNAPNSKTTDFLRLTKCLYANYAHLFSISLLEANECIELSLSDLMAPNVIEWSLRSVLNKLLKARAVGFNVWMDFKSFRHSEYGNRVEIIWMGAVSEAVKLAPKKG
jgi:hypothetical protein